MSASVNRVQLLGNLGADPELRYTPNQAAVATLSIATTEYRKTADGQSQPHTEWHRVVVWNKQAENCAKYLKKGRSVFVEGKLQTRSWDDANGVKKYTTEIIAQNVQFIGGQGRDDAYTENRGSRSNDTNQPSSSFQAADEGFDLNVGSMPDIDEIPF